MPEYERELYKKKKTMTIDTLNFDKEELVVMEGSALLNVPLHDIMS